MKSFVKLFLSLSLCVSLFAQSEFYISATAPLKSPAAAGIVKTTDTSSNAAIAGYLDILGLFSGTPSAATYLAGDGTNKAFPTIPTNSNQLINGANFITSAGAPVQSVYGHTGIVVPTSTDVLGVFSGTKNATTALYGDGTLKTQATVAQTGSYTDLINRTDNQLDPALSSFQTALAAAGTTPVSVVWVGDSTSACSFADCLTAVYDPNNVAPMQVKNYLQGIYGNHGTGLIPISMSSINTTAFTYPQNQWTVSGTGSLPTSTGFGPRQTTPYVGYTLAAMAGGSQTATIKGPGAATSVVIYGATNTDSSVGCGVTLDGIAQTAFGGSTSGSYAAIATSYTTTGTGAHTLVLTSPATGTCYVYGAEFVSGTTGVSMHNLSRSGHASNGYGNSTSDQLPWLSAINSNSGPIGLVVISLGTNDANNSGTTTPTQFQTYMQNIINAFRAANANVPIILAQPWSNNFSSPSTHLTEAQLTSSYATLITNNTNIALVNMNTRWGSIATAQAAGMLSYSDGVHETDTGARDFAYAIESKIIPTASLYGASRQGGVGPLATQGGPTLSLLSEPYGTKVLMSGSGGTAYPNTFDMGSSYSTVSGQNAKFLTFHQGKDYPFDASNTAYAGIGFSVSGGVAQHDFLTYGGYNSGFSNTGNIQTVFSHRTGGIASGSTVEVLRLNPGVGGSSGAFVSTAGTVQAGAVNTQSFYTGTGPYYQYMYETGTAYPYVTIGTSGSANGVLAASGVQLASRTAVSCVVGQAGFINYIHTNSSTKDVVQVCAQDASGTYAWRAIY